MTTSCLVTSVGEKYKSLLNDTLKNIPLFIDRIFIINDTGKQLSYETNDNRVVILNNKKSIGLSKSLEKWSKEYFKYELIFRIDVGDKSHKKRFINQYNFMINNNNYVLCACQSKLKIGNKEKNSFFAKKSFIIKLILYFRNCLIHGSICIRSDALQKVGGYNGLIKTCQDLEMYLKLMKCGKFKIIKGLYHKHTFNKKISTTLTRRKENYKNTSIIRFTAAKESIIAAPLLLASSSYYYLRYLLEN